MIAGKQYLVTNIRFESKAKEIIKSGHQRVEFQVPEDTNEIHSWLYDFDITCSDKIANAIYIRSRLFYYWNMTYDFKLIKDLPVADVYQVNVPTFADIADIDNVEYKTVTADITIPAAYIATLSTNDILFADNDVEQALFENMLMNIVIDFNVLTLTDRILETAADYMNEINAGCPDSIAEAVIVEAIPSETLTDHQIEDVYNSIHSLASALVKEPGKYL